MNEYQYKVSVITAVYNVEDYLEEMIESIIAQNIGIENIQLVLVDDGSKDTSGEICDRYAMQYPENIVVVHKENGGVSSSRNEGLMHAKGEYINFTDADDKLSCNALNKMYDYLKENEEWIDLVAINMKYFGARRGKHPLDYKYKRTKIVELRDEYNFIQLSISGTLVKKSCFDNRKFDLKLKYAEDAQLVVDILLDKMRYGIVCGANYWYRKRETGGSALDMSGRTPDYYIPVIKGFTLFSLENALTKKGYIPQFVQYTCMYELQWRIKQNPLVNKDVLSMDDEQEYKALILKALQYIDNNIILEQTNIAQNYKTALVLKKEHKKEPELIACKDDLQIGIKGDLTSARVGTHYMTYEFIEIYQDKIIIEGHVRYPGALDDVKVLLKEIDDGTDCEQIGEDSNTAEYVAELFDRSDKCTFCMDEVITWAKGFRFILNRNNLADEVKLQLFLRYRNYDIKCKNISFGKFFPLSKKLKSSYLCYDGLLLTYYAESVLTISKIINTNVVRKCELKLQKEISSKNNKMTDRGRIARKIYHLLKHFKKKELWLISDRLTRADDNGEALFTYIKKVKKNSDIDVYFVLDKRSEDYGRLKKLGKVVSYYSTKYKILALLCDKIISSQADEFIFNRFFDLSYLYRDIQYQQKLVFLQHGVTKDNQSRWLAKGNKNLSMFVTATYMEHQSIFDYDYYYDERQVKCTGFPRYDYLYDNSQSQNVITFMPTWRLYWTGAYDVHTDSRTLKDGFEDSSYCQMYRQVFSNDRLIEAAQKYQYEIRLMLHPAMPKECVEYFKCSDVIQILDRNTRYSQLYADSKLIITDYSSAVFDFAYLRKPVLYYQQDVNEFFSGKHLYDKGYFDYEKDGFGEVEYTSEALVNRIIEYMENGCRLKDMYRNRIDKTFPYNDKDNCKRVYEEIIKL